MTPLVTTVHEFLKKGWPTCFATCSINESQYSFSQPTFLINFFSIKWHPVLRYERIVKVLHCQYMHGMNHTCEPSWYFGLMEPIEALYFLPDIPLPWQPFKYKEKASLIGKGVSVIFHLDRTSISTKEDLMSWPELVSYLVQMSLAKAEVHQCIILTQILNEQSFPHWMVLSSMPLSIWSCTHATILRRSSMMEVESTLLISNISDLETLELETDDKVLLLLMLLLLLLYFSSKLKSSKSLLLLTSSWEIQKHKWLIWHLDGTQG